MLLKFRFLILFVFACSTMLAQNKEPIAAGVMYLQTHKSHQFTDLKFEGAEVVFTDAAQKQQRMMVGSVERITDTNGNVVYKRPETEAEIIKRENALLKQKQDSIDGLVYPEGIYKTKEDFINKKVSTEASFGPYNTVNPRRPIVGEVVDEVFFYYLASDTKVKNVFAISYKGNIYFQIYSILDNRNKQDRAQSSNRGNTFVRVLMAGKNYMYVEADLVNAWAYAATGSAGIAGAVAAQGMIKGKGIVWDVQKKEFNIFKNCKNYNDFIAPIYPQGVQPCSDHQPNIAQVRQAIQIIK